jgi:hypothetical protein
VPGLHLLAGREIIDDPLQPFRRQVFVGVLENLHHRRVDAGAEAFHLFPRQVAVGGHMMRFGMDLVLTDLDQAFSTAQLAGDGAADLNVRLLAHRGELEHGVEGRHFQHADVGHAQHVATYSMAARVVQPSCS